MTWSHGLAFGCRQKLQKLPKSLLQLIAEIEQQQPCSCSSKAIFIQNYQQVPKRFQSFCQNFSAYDAGCWNSHWRPKSRYGLTFTRSGKNTSELASRGASTSMESMNSRSESAKFLYSRYSRVFQIWIWRVNASSDNSASVRTFCLDMYPQFWYTAKQVSFACPRHSIIENQRSLDSNSFCIYSSRPIGLIFRSLTTLSREQAILTRLTRCGIILQVLQVL